MASMKRGRVAEATSRRALLAAPAALWAGLACRRPSPRPGGSPPPRWRPILVATDGLEVPAPPAPGSPDERQDLADLVARQESRTAAEVAATRTWSQGACVRWNEIARELVARHRVDVVRASRYYALLGVAQYDAVVAAWRQKLRHQHPAPQRLSSQLRPLEPGDDLSYPCQHATVAAASAAVLGYLIAGERERLERAALDHARSRLTVGTSTRRDVEAGQGLGRAVGTAVVEHARSDGADAVWSGAPPGGPGCWKASSGRAALCPAWGQVRPWLMKSGAQFRASPPPAWDSPEFRRALAEVRHLSDTRTTEQARIAALWADGAGSYAPAGRWNKIAADLIREGGLPEPRAARTFALLNMALMDAGIACWDSKFHYWVLRPYQADPAIITPVGRPEFPSYTSAHAAFSAAGAGVLGHVFPEEARRLDAKADEASMSRVYGGIHYRFDAEAGAAQGRRVAALARERSMMDGAS